MAKHGIKFFYHTHGYEFLPHGDGTLFDLLMAETKPEYVRIEMDVFWIVHPGQDPVKFLEKYGKRIDLMHVKDMKRGTPRGPPGRHPPRDQSCRRFPQPRAKPPAPPAPMVRRRLRKHCAGTAR